MAGIAKRLGCTWNSNAIIRHGNVIAQTFGPLVLTVVPLSTLRANTSILVGYGTKIGRCAIATRRRWVGPRTNQCIHVGVIIIIVVAGVIGKVGPHHEHCQPTGLDGIGQFRTKSSWELTHHH